MTEWKDWVSLVGILITALAAYGASRLANRAQNAKTHAEKEVGAGQLALDIANRLDREVGDLRKWQREIRRWWPRHEEWDDALLSEIEKLDPGATARMPTRPNLPID